MISKEQLSHYYMRLVNNDPNVLNELYAITPELQDIAVNLITDYKAGKVYDLTAYINFLDPFMHICNIIYNNFDATCIIDDGIYDMLMNIYKTLMPENYQVGGEPVNINFEMPEPIEEDLDGYYCPIMTVDESRKPLKDWLFKDNLFVTPPIDVKSLDAERDRTKFEQNVKSTYTIPHKYPKLVGTLDKCKFTLMSEISDPDIFNDPTIKIFERDFLGAHLQRGILDPNHIELLLELKMDGMSVEADVNNKIISARSRGDTGLDLADDLTVVFKDYPFPNCPPLEESFGMKFECIITKSNLERLSKLKGREYKNARNGVIGLVKSIDAAAYQDLLTLVPLETSLDVDPVSEVKFMNQYFAKDVYLPYAVVSGDYNTVLYQVYEFVKEAEAHRDVANYMYDGVVVHYTDPKIRQILGRENSVNKYSIAIKFNPLKKRTTFRGYTYEVGQNGVIIPMAHYDPVEFIGTIHTKSSCHSYGRFVELGLAVGDPVDLSYVNDVMPYLTNPYEIPKDSRRTPVAFPAQCPCCGSPIIFSDAMDSACCSNFHCPDRQIARVTNMLDKLSFKGFAESSIRKLGIKSLTGLLSITAEEAIEKLGEGNGRNFMKAKELFLSTPIQDYRLIGSLGFTNTAANTWKKILEKIPIDMILGKDKESLKYNIASIYGIGGHTATTIINELQFYAEDINTIRHLPNVVYTYGNKQKTIRWTGCRDTELEEYLNNLGYDANSKSSATKTTDMLIVPYTGYSSTKMNKIGPKTLIVSIDEMKRNTDYYLSLL